MTRLVILGPPGAGKGTQAQQIAERYGVPAVSTGEIFRAAALDDTELGRQARGAMSAGRLVPDEVTNALVARRLDAADAADGFLLDGFPRTLQQAVELDAILTAQGKPLDAVLLLEADDNEIVRRLSGRRTCRACAAVWHVEFRPTRRRGICDACGGELYQRADDTRATIVERLHVYATYTAPLIDFYRDAGLLVSVAAVGGVEEIGDAITAELDRVVAARSAA